MSATHCLAPTGKQGFRMSSYYQELACLLGQALPFDEASILVEKLIGQSLSDKQIERLCHHYGEALEELADQEPVHQADESLHYAMMDGSMVYVREQGWKELKLGRVFASADRIKEKKRRAIRQSNYVAHLGKHRAFLKKFEHLLCGKKQVVAIADGTRWIWDYWDSEHPEAVQILDGPATRYYHVVEKLGEWAVQVFSNQAARQTWMCRQEERLLSDQAEEVMEAIRQVTCRTAKKQQNQLLPCLNNNLSRIRYKTYRDQGYCIGSGAIEAAHRHVIQKSSNSLGSVGRLRGCNKSLTYV